MSRANMAQADALADETFEDETAPGLTFQALAALPAWVAWRAPNKLPLCPKTGVGASSTNPETWGTRRQAEARKAGVGIMLGHHAGLPGVCLGGVDLDTCRDAATGTLETWASGVLAMLGSYAEVSPSGTGVKVFFTYETADLGALKAAIGGDAMGKLWKRGTGKHPPAIELHLGKRYYTVTGQRLPTSPPDLKPVPRASLLRLIKTDGPAFTGPAAAPTPKAKDGSRSGRALALAGKVRRKGWTREDFEEALRQDSELSFWASDPRQVERTWARSGDGLGDYEGFAFNEDGVALAFAARFRDRLRFDHHAGQWFQWSGVHWRREETRLAFAWARDTSRDMAKAGKLDPESKPLAKAATAAAVERFAQADRAFAVTSEIWDTDAWLLGTPGGTVDLRTGTLRPAAIGEFITKLTATAPEAAYDPDLDCPKWREFLIEATGGNQDLVAFLQRWCGYALTGDTREHALLFIYGPGGNGKSVFLNTATRIMGDYCRTAGMDVFSKSQNDRHSQELARLKGARLVCASETEEGRAWAEVRIKQLTGGDMITARFMRQNDFEFRPEFKLTIIGNNKPALHSVDDAARRRFNVVPFEYRPGNPDPELESKLQSEWPGILSWMIQGCLMWQRDGLVRPEIVKAATAEYFENQDVFGQWLAERCEKGRGYAATTASLMADWAAFAQESGEANRISPRTFADRLRSKGFVLIKNSHGIRSRGFSGLRLTASETVADDGECL